MQRERKAGQQNGLAEDMHVDKEKLQSRVEEEQQEAKRGKGDEWGRDLMNYLKSILQHSGIVGYSLAGAGAFLFLYSRGYFPFFNWVITAGSLVMFFYGLAYAQAHKRIQEFIAYATKQWQERTK